jgi:hypothetical protein
MQAPKLILFFSINGKTKARRPISSEQEVSTRGKKFAGRGKPWGNCRRLKVTRDDLELLTYQNNHPVSFGWRFSTIKMPSSFVRSHGLHVNKQSKLRKKRLSNIPTVKDMDEEYSRYWPLPIGFPLKRLHRRQEIQYRDAVKALPGRFIRLTIS